MGIAIIKGEFGANALGRTRHNITPKDPNKRKLFTNNDLKNTIWEEDNGVYKVVYINLGEATQHYKYILCDSDGNELQSQTGVSINQINGNITLDSNYDGSAVYAKVVPIVDNYYNVAINTTAVLVIGESSYTLNFAYNNSQGINARPQQVSMTSFTISEDGVVVTSDKSELSNASVIVKENTNVIFSSNDITASLVIPGNTSSTYRDLIVTIQGTYNGVPLSKSFVLPQGADAIDTISAISYSGSLGKGTTIDPNDFKTTATYLSGKNPYQIYGISVTPNTIQNSTATYTVTFEGNKSGQIELIPEDTLKVAYATNVSTDIKDGEDVLLTVGSTATSGRTLATNKTELNLVATTSNSETFIGYSDLGGNLITNPVNIIQHPIVVPKVKGNLMYTKYTGYQWCYDQQVLNEERYRLYRKSNTNFCASSVIWTTTDNPLLFTIPSLANQSVSFEVVNPNSVKGTFKIEDIDLVHKIISLNLDSNGQANYQPSYTGMVVFNFAKEEVAGYTAFTNSQLEEIQINYANVDAWSVPSVKIDTILEIGGINQSLVYYNGYVITFRNNIGAIFIIDVESKSIVRQVPVTSVTTSSIHCNAATLTPIKYNNSDFFPMIVLSGDGSIARVIRLAGADPNTVTASKVCDYTFKYNYKDSLVGYDGMVTISDNNFYYLRWPQTLSKINIDLTDIHNYTDRDIVANVDGIEISAKIVKTGQDITIVPSSRGDIFVSQYGPEPYYWNTYSSTNLYYINGITLCSIREGGNIVGHIPFYGIRFNQGEPDGIAYAGNNVFYIVINTTGQATLYRLTIPFPEF